MSIDHTPGPGDSRKQVFVSYARTAENAGFVRDLVAALDSFQFDTWLDEERMNVGGDVETNLREAIARSEAAVFIVTPEWLERDWTRFEAQLLGRRRERRCVVILRDGVQPEGLPPHLMIKGTSISWLAKEAEPDARMWEVHCAITGAEPGKRSEWAKQGARLLRRGAGAGGAGGREEPRDGAAAEVSPAVPLSLPCAGRPVKAVVGRRWAFIVTDHDEWLGIGQSGLHPALAPLAGHSSVILNAEDELLVGMYEPVAVRLRSAHWEYLPVEAPVLCLASSDGGDLAGTAAGGIVRVAAQAERPVLRVREPVVGMASVRGGLVLLGSRGLLGSCSLDTNPELKWLDAGDLGRPVGLFAAAEADRVGVMSSDRLGTVGVSSKRVDAGALRFEQGIREVAFIGARNLAYAVLTDAGELLLVSMSLNEARQVRFPADASIAGFSDSGGFGSIAAWTPDGHLYVVSGGGRVQQIARDRVVLAHWLPGLPRELAVVRWSADQRATVERVALDVSA